LISWMNPFQRENHKIQDVMVSSPPPELAKYDTFEIAIYNEYDYERNNGDTQESDTQEGETESKQEIQKDDGFICKVIFNNSCKYQTKQKLLSFASRARKYRMNDKNLAVYIDNIKFYIRTTVSYLLLLLTNEM
jgi:hypothetical protein